MDSTKDDPEFIHKTWLRSKFNELVKSLVQVLLAPQSEDALRVRFFFFIPFFSSKLILNSLF